MDLHSHFWILTHSFKPLTRAFKLSARNSQLALYHITCIIGFLINAALLNVYFTLHRYYFFVKKFIFPNVYISVNKIFECLYLFFGWERGHQLSTCATAGGWRVIQNVYSCVQGEGVSRLSFHVFGRIFVLQRLVSFVEI